MNLIIYILFLTFLVLALLVCMAFALTGARERLSVRDYARLRAEQDAFVTVDGYEHHFEDVGPRDGPALVLVHGFAGSLFTWRNQRQPLLDAGYRLLLVDLLGFGGSQRVAAPVYDTQHHAALVLGVMDKLEIREAGVLGHSYGGRIAMQMALLAPERVGAIVAISPEAFAVARPPIARAVSPPLLGYALAFYSTSPQLVRAGLKYSSGNRPWLTDAIVTGYSQPLYVRGNVAAQIWQSKSPKDGDRPVPRHLAEIAAPTLLIWGELDRVFPAADGQRLTGILPSARLCVVKDAGHLAHEEAPGEVNDALLSFLRRAEPAATAM